MIRFSRRLIPNGLSLARLVLGLVFPWLPADGRTGVIAVAALTDLLDGAVARWLRCESDTGRILDPVADKVFVLSLAGTLLAEGALTPGWALAVAARDVVVLGGVAVTFLRGRWADYQGMKPTWLGKCTTAAQFALLLALATQTQGGTWLWFLTAGLSVLAAADYARSYGRRSSRGGPR